MSDIWSHLAQHFGAGLEAVSPGSTYSHQAAVLVLLTDEPDPRLIYGLRAKHLSAHPGEVCFPGGMWEHQDQGLLDTAIRETFEEIGVPRSAIVPIGALSPRKTRNETLVTPFIAKIPADARFVVNADEIEAVFALPLSVLRSGIVSRVDVFQRNGASYRIPVYAYEGYEIWGFTAAVTTEILQRLRFVAEVLPDAQT